MTRTRSALSIVALTALIACTAPQSRSPASENNPAAPTQENSATSAQPSQGLCEPTESSRKMLNIIKNQSGKNRENFVKALQQAFENCPGISRLFPGVAGMAALANSGWTCKQTSEFFTEPKNAIVFLGDAIEFSHPLEDGTVCYNRDFRERYCRPARGYAHEDDQPMHGWCAYIPSNS